MDSQGSGTGKSPVGRRGTNKGRGGRRRAPGKEQNNPGKGPTGNRVPPRTLVPTPTVTPTHNPIPREAPIRDEPNPLPPDPPPTLPPAADPATAPTATPAAAPSTLLMNTRDDKAPQTTFTTLKPLTGKIMSAAEWVWWCERLEKWTKALARWSNERSKQSTAQEAWKRRQNQKGRKQQDRREDGEQEEGAERRPQGRPTRSRTITRMANLQRNYNASPRKCMDVIRHTHPPIKCEVPIGEVSEHFKGKLAAPLGIDPNAPPPYQLWTNTTPQDVMAPIITPEEVKKTLQAMDLSSAPGPDRIQFGTWKHLDPKQEIVTTILNTCRANGKIPPAWKVSSTILIHKGDDPATLDNWRPIALQNTLYRVYAAIIAKRISTWAIQMGVMSASQKGFLPTDGCLEHNHLMKSVLQDSRRMRRPAYLAYLDLKDAYGSVPHEILFKTMETAGLEGSTLGIVKDFYQDTTTTIRTKSSTTDPISINRGVKQGCPLSPILFNLVMEVLIRAAEGVPGAGYRVADTVIRSLAYADDLCVLAPSPVLLQEVLDKLHTASGWAGLTFSPRKCATLAIVRSYRARQRIDKEAFRLGGWGSQSWPGPTAINT